MSEWHAVETAPKIGPLDDEQWLLIFDPEHGVRTALHSSEDEWISEDSFSPEIRFNPTHWMPLPDPPI